MTHEKRLIKLQRILHESLQWGYDDVTDTEYLKCVETAEKMIAHGVTVQGDKDINVPIKWISVKDRLPELHTKVLCCGIKGGRFIAETSEWGEGILYWTKRDGKGCPTVTHWMPLPEPPKGE